MAIRNFVREATRSGGYEGSHRSAPIYVDSDASNVLKMVPGGAGSTTEVQVVDASSTQTLTAKTLTSPTLTAPVISGTIAWTSPTLTTPTINGATGTLTILNDSGAGATVTLTAAQSGTTIFLNDDTETAYTLPAVAAGLNYRFIVGQAPSGASYTIVTPAGAELIVGVVVTSAGDSGADAQATVGAQTLTFVDGQSKVGDQVFMICDGTYWYVIGETSAVANITMDS